MKELQKSNFIVTEDWTVLCPNCGYEQEAPFNEENPMQPLEIDCEECTERFIVTYERD